MRFAGGCFVVVLIAGAIVFHLMQVNVTSTSTAITMVADELREQHVVASRFDPDTARAMIDAMALMVADPKLIASATDELETFSDTAAAWADDSSPGPDLHASAMLRRAAGELREHALRPSASHLVRARRCLDAGRRILDGDPGASGSGGGGGLAVGAIRDRLDNLEQSHREQRQEVEEGLRE